MTSRSRKRDSSVMMSSVRPSAKNSCSGSPLMLTSGRTAMDGVLAIGIATRGALATGGGGRLKPDPKDADGTGDILDALVTDILERDVVQSLADLIAHRARDTDAARLGE